MEVREKILSALQIPKMICKQKTRIFQLQTETKKRTFQVFEFKLFNNKTTKINLLQLLRYLRPFIWQIVAMETSDSYKICLRFLIRPVLTTIPNLLKCWAINSQWQDKPLLRVANFQNTIAQPIIIAQLRSNLKLWQWGSKISR